MKRTAIAAVLVAVVACSKSGSRESSRVADQASGAIRRGELTSAQLLAEQALSDSKFSPDSVWPWTFRLLRAESLVLQLRARDARADLTDPLPASPDFDALRTRQKYLQARAEVTEGRLPPALAIIEAALDSPATPDVRLDLGVLAGQVRLRLGRRTDAESILNGVVAQAARAGDHYHEALALNNLGMARLTASRFDDALPWFERVLAFQDLERFSVYAAALSNAGTCYNELGDFERAIAMQSNAVTLFERRGVTAQYVQALSELGRSLLVRDDSASAVTQLRKAFDAAQSAGMATDASLVAAALAEAYANLGNWADAQRFNDESVRLKQETGVGKLVHNRINSAKIAEGQGELDAARKLYNAALAESPEAVIQLYGNAGLARIALAGRDRATAARHFERALQVIERTRSDLLKTDYKLSYLSTLIQFYREYVDALVDQGDVARALEVADSSRGRVLAERQKIASPGRVAADRFHSAARDSGGVLLFYWLKPQASWLWVVTPRDLHLVALPAGERIAALVEEHQRMIASGVADPLSAETTPGAELYKALVAPAARWLPSGARVLIAPDGALHGLNFETLPVVSVRPHYWVEDVEVQTVPSLGLLAASASRRPDGKSRQERPDSSVLLIGSPTVSDPKFPALSYASAEMSRVAGHFDPGHVVSYQGAQASPMAYRSASLNRFSMIHFTAHAATNVESPLDSAVILASENGSYKLYARDVADQALQADLVTISACRGAGGRAFSGEGLVGFAWAFLRAGARRVIAGLWDVDDQSTADLMDVLYAGLARGESPSTALRGAKLTMIARGGALARPYYWGPFELFTVTP